MTLSGSPWRCGALQREEAGAEQLEFEAEAARVVDGVHAAHEVVQVRRVLQRAMFGADGA